MPSPVKHPYVTVSSLTPAPSCGQLRGGMDASQYKDYVLTLLFMDRIEDLHRILAPRIRELPAPG